MLNKQCADQICALLQDTEMCMNVRKEVYYVFIGLKKAYEKVNTFVLWNFWDEYGVEGWFISLNDIPT